MTDNGEVPGQGTSPASNPRATELALVRFADNDAVRFVAKRPRTTLFCAGTLLTPL